MAHQVDSFKLRQDCDLAWTIWLRQTGGFQLVVLRDRGVEDLVRLKSIVLDQHQDSHYLEGLRKLGISGDPPAIAAAKYHYLSNIIGGVKLDYVEETSKKVWIRYTHPNEWFHGSALLAVPSVVQRSVFAGWHARNGEKIGCSRLGYVCTKVMQDGEPYDEDYFIEYERDIASSEAIRYEAVTRSLEFDPDKAPKLDPREWPEERILRARRKYAGAFVRTYVKALLDFFGLGPACHLIAQTMSLIAVQNIDDIRTRIGISDTSIDDATIFLDRLLGSRADDYSIEKVGPSRRAIVLRSYQPLGDDTIDELRRACFAFPAMCVRLLNGHIRITRQTEPSGGSRSMEVWQLEDTGRWLY